MDALEQGVNKIGPYLDILPVCGVGLVLLCSVPMKRRTYWHVEMVYHALIGLSLLLCPGCVFSSLVSAPLDGLHLFLLRFVGAMHFGHALFNYLTRNNIGHMNGSVFYCRAVTGAFLLIAEQFTAFHLWGKRGLHPNEKFVATTLIVHGTWFLGSVVHMIRAGDGPVGVTVVTKGWLSHGMILDGFFCLLHAMGHYAFPNQILKLITKSVFTIDGVHVCLCRMFGSFMVGWAIAAHWSPGLSNDNKKAHIYSRILTHVLLFALNTLGHFGLEVFSMYHMTPYMISGFYITFLLSLHFRLHGDERNGPYRDVTITTTTKKTR